MFSILALTLSTAQAQDPCLYALSSGPGDLAAAPLCDSDGDGTPDPLDCAPFNKLIHPNALEIPGDNVDQNCDDTELCYKDSDNDGARSSITLVSADTDCFDPSEGEASDPIDCDDGDDTIYPDANEVVGDGVDQDCDQMEVCYVDADNDGARTSATVNSTDTDCTDSNEGRASDPIDCDDGSSSVYPDAPEVTGDEIDQDCDGREVCYRDGDLDGDRHQGSTITSLDTDCDDPEEAAASAPVDCDDADPSRSSSASEIPGDNIDQDCNGWEVCYADNDDDGARTSSTVNSNDDDCNDTDEGLASDPIDCDDNDASIHPGATEAAGDEVDQNCDGSELCFVDGDDDGARTTSTVSSADLTCDGSGEGRLTDVIDCDDGEASIYPGATEVVGDEVDQDCDGAEVCYLDDDDDGARTTSQQPSSDADCDDANEASASAPLDCDDSDPAISPTANEIPGDGVDQDCDDTELCFVDADLDGARSTDTVSSAYLLCDAAGEAASGAEVDCDDSEPTSYPGAPDTVGDGIDSDCDGAETCYVDADDDGARTDASMASADGDCDDVGEALLSAASDCDDGDPDVFPGAAEVPGDGIDSDCDALEACYIDDDADGYGDAEAELVYDADLTCSAAGLSDNGDDCDDRTDVVSPANDEVLCTLVDEDCDEATPDDVDADGDTFTFCTYDCDDTDPTINPARIEIECNGVDDDCNYDTPDCSDTGVIVVDPTGSTGDTAAEDTGTGIDTDTDTDTIPTTTDTGTVPSTTTDTDVDTQTTSEKGPKPEDPDYGCGCSGAPSVGGVLPIALLALLRRRRQS